MKDTFAKMTSIFKSPSDGEILNWADVDPDEDLSEYLGGKLSFLDPPHKGPLCDINILGSKSVDFIEAARKKKRTGRRRDRRNRKIILSGSEASSGEDTGHPEQGSGMETRPSGIEGRFIVTDPGPSDPAHAQIEIGKIRALLKKKISGDLLVSRTSGGIVCLCDRRDIVGIKRESSPPNYLTNAH